MLFDTHIHTDFSTDSQMKLPEVLAASQALKVGAVITEHMDLKYPQAGSFVFDVDKYFSDYGSYRAAGLLLGVEIGMRGDCIDDNRTIVADYPFDMVIGSIHLVDGIDIYQRDFYASRSKAEAYTRYLEVMRDCLAAYDYIDTLGHIDYIARYSGYPDAELYYGEFADHIDEVLRLAAMRGLAMEINTRRFADKRAIEALVPIYKRFFELGGRLATIGSDAHKPAAVGAHLELAYDMAAYCGLRPVYYVQRQAEYIKG